MAIPRVTVTNSQNPGQSSLILGATGQVGRALTHFLGPGTISLSRAQADLSRPQSLREVLDQYRPAVIYNAAAYTQVDLAEREEEQAFLANAESPAVLAEWAAQNQAILIHYSTDYVFSGEGIRPWTEQDPVSPQNAYGRTKLEGEHRIARAGGRYLIFRTSWVYDATGKNFVTSMLKLGSERELLKIVADQTGAPTYAPHLAETTLRAVKNATEQKVFPSGIYHLCNSGETTWFDFSQAIFSGARTRGLSLKVKNVLPIPSSEFPTPAKRPKNSRLDNHKAATLLKVVMPTWESGLNSCMDAMTQSERKDILRENH